VALMLKRTGVLILLSAILSAAAGSVCACRHHLGAQASSLETSCHEHGMAGQSDVTQSDQTTVSDSACSCPENAPHLYARSGSVQFEKQIAALPSIPAEIILRESVQPPLSWFLAESIRYSDQSPGSSGARAPPRL